MNCMCNSYGIPHARKNLLDILQISISFLKSVDTFPIVSYGLAKLYSINWISWMILKQLSIGNEI